MNGKTSSKLGNKINNSILQRLEAWEAKPLNKYINDYSPKNRTLLVICGPRKNPLPLKTIKIYQRNIY